MTVRQSRSPFPEEHMESSFNSTTLSDLIEEMDLPECDHYELDEFKIMGLLGEGKYGVVQAALHLRTRQTVAIKFLVNTREMDEDTLAALCFEIQILLSFKDSKFLGTCLGMCVSDDAIGIVMPVYAGGDLFSLIDDDKQFPNSCRYYVAAEIVAGLEEMHERKIINRDLKLENILIDNERHVKIVDFGFCKKLTSKHERAISVVGTPDYTSPEIITRQTYGFGVDIWAFGIILFELFCRMPPFNIGIDDSTETKFNRVLSGHLVFPCGCPGKLVDLVSKILVQDPAKRITLKGIKEHPFFGSINWERVKKRQTPQECLPRVHIDLDMPTKNFVLDDSSESADSSSSNGTLLFGDFFQDTHQDTAATV